MAQRTTFICACLIKQVLRTMPRHIVVLQPRDQGITQCASRKSIPMSSTPRTTSAGRHTIPPPPRITTADPGQIHHPQNRATPAPSHRHATQRTQPFHAVQLLHLKNHRPHACGPAPVLAGYISLRRRWRPPALSTRTPRGPVPARRPWRAGRCT